MKDKFGSPDEIIFERSVREKAPPYFCRFLRRIKVWSFKEIAGALEDAEGRGLITEEEK